MELRTKPYIKVRLRVLFWGGLWGLLSEELPRVAAVLKLDATTTKRSDSSRELANKQETSVLSRPVP